MAAPTGVLISVVANVTINIGLNTQKHAHLRHQRAGGHGSVMAASPVWWLGITLQLLGEVGNMVGPHRPAPLGAARSTAPVAPDYMYIHPPGRALILTCQPPAALPYCRPPKKLKPVAHKIAVVVVATAAVRAPAGGVLLRRGFCGGAAWCRRAGHGAWQQPCAHNDPTPPHCCRETNRSSPARRGPPHRIASSRPCS